MEAVHLTPAVTGALEALDTRHKSALHLGQQMMAADDDKLFPVDLLAIGGIKRCLSQVAGFKLLVEACNLVCARGLLRLQIDSALRFFAVFLVEEPHCFAGKVLGGEQINKIKDRNGKRMTDAYLVSRLASDHPWLPKVYKITSGYVHFSDRHLFAPVHSVDHESRSVQYVLSDTDTNYPEATWVEVIECFTEATDIFLKYLEGWVFTKANPKLVAEIKAARENNIDGQQ